MTFTPTPDLCIPDCHFPLDLTPQVTINCYVKDNWLSLWRCWCTNRCEKCIYHPTGYHIYHMHMHLAVAVNFVQDGAQLCSFLPVDTDSPLPTISPKNRVTQISLLIQSTTRNEPPFCVIWWRIKRRYMFTDVSIMHLCGGTWSPHSYFSNPGIATQLYWSLFPRTDIYVIYDKALSMIPPSLSHKVNQSHQSMIHLIHHIHFFGSTPDKQYMISLICL